MEKLLAMSLSGALIICVIFLARLLLQNNVHRTVWLLLWAVAVLRLLLPLSVAAGSSIFNLPMFRTPEPVAVQVETVQPMQTEQIPQTVPTEAPAPAKLSAADILRIVWLTGAVGISGYFIINHILARRRYRFAVPAELVGVPDTVRVKELEGLSSPLTYGLLRPVILLPQGLSEDPDRCRHILSHELSHIRHLDVAYKGILLLTAAIHWFNPFVWVMVFTASQDMEMRCDADAIHALGEKNAYAKTLVEAEETKLRGYLQTGFSFSSTAQRLRAIVKMKASKPLSICAGILMTALLLAVFCTGRVTPAAKAAYEPEQLAAETVSVLQAETEPAEIEDLSAIGSEPATEALTETEAAPEQTAEPTETKLTETSPSSETEPKTSQEFSLQPQTSSDEYDEVVTVTAGRKTTVFFKGDVVDSPYDSSIARILSRQYIAGGYSCVIQGLKEGSTVIKVHDYSGLHSYRVLVVVKAAQQPSAPDTPTETQPQPSSAPYPLTEPTEPPAEELPTPAPTVQLPTQYNIASPGSITLHVGQTAYYSVQSASILNFSYNDGLTVDAQSSVMPGDINEIHNYRIGVTAHKEGTYQIWCMNQNGATTLWATVTVLP